jgi:hypothetical protein
MFKYIVYFFDLKLSEGVQPIIEFSFNMALVCLAILFCFINVFGYLISIHLIKYYDIENKYSKYKRIINYFLKSS